MALKIAKYFIMTSLFFFFVGCIEGLMFPSKFALKSFYSAVFHISPDQMKSFFGHFVAKIHTHINLVGWVGSALMGILYFLAPQISGTERYPAWAAYGNWGCHTAGVVLMTLGFHLIGVFGLASGYEAGSPGFRAVAAPFKSLVALGGILITVSTALFIVNITRTLFATPGREATTVAVPRESVNSRVRAVRTAAAALAVILAGAFVPAAQASPAAVPQPAAVIMIGDRLVDVAHGLGVVPAAMSVRCSMWPLCERINTAVQVLGCPNCLTKKKAVPLLKFAEKHDIRRVLIEKSDPFCAYVPDLELEKIATFLDGKGFAIEFVDFTNGLASAVRQAAALLNCPEKAADLLSNHEKALEQTRKKMTGRNYVKKVVIINGTYQPATGKAFLRIEAPGGYADRFLLRPMGIENACYQMVDAEKLPSKGHIAIRKLDGLIAAAPDAIVMTGDALAVQKALASALAKSPALAGVPALKNHAVYSLPGYIDSSVVEYPRILRKWADVLAR